jgi:hypothetical protein
VIQQGTPQSDQDATAKESVAPSDIVACNRTRRLRLDGQE